MNPSLKIRKIHRWIGILFSFSALLASGSGVVHNVMTRTQAPPPAARPAGESFNLSAINISLKEAAEKLFSNHAPIHGISFRVFNGDPWYQFLLEGDQLPFYVNARTGDVDMYSDEKYAREIAEKYLSRKNLVSVKRLVNFDSEYLNIFRILPVYRFDTQDPVNTRVYVSTMTGSVTRFTDDKKQIEASIFTNFHKLGFIKNKDLRDFVLTTTTAGIFVLSLFGVILFFMTFPRR